MSHKLHGTELYRKTCIHSSQTREERLIRANMKTILAELPKGNEYRLTGYGWIVKNRAALSDKANVGSSVGHTGGLQEAMTWKEDIFRSG